MSDYIKVGLKITWGLFILIWTVSSFNTKKTVQTEPRINRFVFYWLPLLIAIYLLGPGKWFGHMLIRENFVPHTNLVGIIGLSISFTGLLLAVWARFALGQNWSATVQAKQDHELIMRGPYRVVRHPIYTGLLLLFLGNAIIVGDYRGLIAVAIVFISLWFKLRKEERLMLNTFGTQYTTYMETTKALVPWVI